MPAEPSECREQEEGSLAALLLWKQKPSTSGNSGPVEGFLDGCSRYVSRPCVARIGAGRIGRIGKIWQTHPHPYAACVRSDAHARPQLGAAAGGIELARFCVRFVLGANLDR